MKGSFLTIILLFSIFTTAQKTFVSVEDGDWNDASTWTIGAGAGGVEGVDYPAANDIVTIDDFVVINATNNGTNFSFTGELIINAGDTLESQVGDNIAGFVLEGNGLMINNGSFFTLDVTEEPDENAKIPYEFVCKGNSVFIGGINSFAFISDDWNIQDNARIFIDNLNCYAVSDDVIFDGTGCFMYGEGNIRIGGDGVFSEVELNNGATEAQIDDDITIWNNTSSLVCGFPGTSVTTGTNAGSPLPFAFDDVFTTGINTVQNQNVLFQGTDDRGGTSADVITLSDAGSDAGASNGATAQGGTVVVNNNGTPGDPTDDYIVYTPPVGFTGVDSYNYLITNTALETDIAQVTVTILECGTSFVADTTFTAVVTQLDNDGVDNPGFITGSPDGSDFAEWYEGDDSLTVDFGQIFTAGTKYILTARTKDATDIAQPVITESTINGAFTTVTTPYTIVDGTSQQVVITSESDFRYLRITKDNAVDGSDFEIDAIQVIEVDCQPDNDRDGVNDAIDIDDDNDGIKDGDENNCSSPEAYWTLDNTTDDASPNNHDERSTGSPPTFSTDAIQGTHSANFNGTSQRIRYSQDGGFMEVEGDTFSFSVWIKPTNLTGFRVLFEEGGGVNGWIVYLENGVAKVGTRAGGAGTQATATSSTTLTVDGQWHHVAGTFNLGVITIYVDGVSNSATAGFTVLPAHTSDGTVGGVTADNPIDINDATQGFYEGLMDAAKYSNFDVWGVNEIGFNCNNDGDALSNQFDLDSDNDGISDIAEAGGEDTNGDGLVDDISVNNLTNDSDNNGLDDRYDFGNGGSQMILADTDLDGLSNPFDLDSDNDGIPDVVEAGGTDSNGDGRADGYFDNDSDGFNDIVDGDVGNDGSAENSGNALVSTDNDGDNDGIPDSILEDDNDGDGIINGLDLDADNDGIPDVVEQGGTDVNGDGRADNFVDEDNDGFNDRVDGDPTNALTTGTDTPGTNSNNALLLTGADTDPTKDGAPNSTPNGNLDQDGVYNYLDLDADDDGILDILEAGGTDVNTDGIEDAFVDSDNDGFNDSVDGDVGNDGTAENTINATTVTDNDGDGDGIPDDYPNDDFDDDGRLNFLDIDADNDGIVDNTEGQSTLAGVGLYEAPDNLDTDGDGIDDKYDNDDALFGGAGSGVAPPDADVAINPGTPDYLDVDADNDGDLDEIEGHDTNNDGVVDGSDTPVANTGLSGGITDIDGDGLLDGFDNNTSSTEPTNGSLLGDSHPNLDIVATTEHDWREALDNDEDGIPDFVDLDDDNDGILDTLECSNQPNFVTTVDAFWTLDGNTLDVSGNGNNQGSGTTAFSYSTTAIEGTNSAQFNGSQGVRYSVDGGFMESNYTNISFSAWILPDNLTGTRIIYEEGGTTHGSVLWLNGSNLTYSTRVSSTQVNVVHQTAVTANADWHHVAVTYNGGAMTVYLNGVPSNTSPSNGTAIPAHGSDGGIGLDFGGGTSANITGGFSGLMDAARYSNTQTWSAADILTESQREPNCDADGDGISNQFDLDSDNDGIPDIVEAGGVDTDGNGLVDDINANGILIADADLDGVADVYDASVGGGADITNPDTDGDGIKDAQDLDSDNDGIPDVVEVGGTDVNGDGRSDDYIDVDEDGFNDVVDGDPNQDGISDNTANALAVTGADTGTDGIPDTFPSNDNDGDGIVNQLDLDSDNDGIPDVVEAGGTDVNGDGRADDYVDLDEDGFNDVVDGDPTNALSVGTDTDGTNAANALTKTGADTDGTKDGAPNSYPNDDFDEDGALNQFDLDADDDGIMDVVEAGGLDTDRNAIADGFVDVDGDGFNDLVDGDTDNSLPVGDDSVEVTDGANALIKTGADTDATKDGVPNTYPNGDFDGDGNLNYLDIDADNDGIVDNTEGQPTTIAGGYVVPTTLDSDGDGIDNAYDDLAGFGGNGAVGYVLSNVDGTGNPDYLDLDSDNDGDLDIIEGHDSDNDGIGDAGSPGPANTGMSGGMADIDGDGLLDGFDNNTASVDPTNGGLFGDGHPNVDNTATTESDWREILDNDNDGVTDIIDVDDDNDGILDVDECPAAYSLNVGGADFTDAQGRDWVSDAAFVTGGALEAEPTTITNLNSGNEIGSTSDALLYSSFRNPGNNGSFSYSLPVENGDYILVFHWGDGFGNGGSRNINIALEGTTVISGYSPQNEFGVSVAGTRTFTTNVSDGTLNVVQSGSGFPILYGLEVFNDVCDSDNDGIVNSYDLDSDNDGIPDIVEAGGEDTNGDGKVDDLTIVGDTIKLTRDSDNDGLDDRYDSNNGGINLTNADFDGDGIPNTQDLDADNDGIMDVVEAGGSDANRDGIEDGFVDSDNDGFNDSVDGDVGNDGTAENTINATTVTDNDGDGDGIPDDYPNDDFDDDGRLNFLDIDADNDGIVDNTEGQSTAGYIAPSGLDSDGDGIDDNYDDLNGFGGDGAVGYLLSDIDVADDPDSPDYLDLNSDNDFYLDAVEGHDSNGDGVADGGSAMPANTGLPGGTTDIDGDGLLDGYDNNTASTDPTNTGLEGEDHPNIGNSATAERDWREVPDMDNDGITDQNDIDKDNDGILDKDECLTTTANAIVGGNGGSTTNFSQDDVTSVYFDFVSVDNGLSISVNGSGIKPANNDLQLFTPNLVAGQTALQFVSDGASLTSAWQTNVNGIPRLRVFIDENGQVSILGSRTNASTSLELMETQDGSSFSTISFVAGSNTFSVVNLDGSGPDNINGTGYVFSSCDTDGDGLPDYCDLDSDNDGIPDIIEAGGADADNNGVVDVFVDSDNDGFADALDPVRGGTALADGDQDGDGFANRIDLDSDDDGLADIVEAGGVDVNNDGVGDVSADTDRDGWFNLFDSDDGGTVHSLPNTDGDVVPNYLDLDSDNDGLTDNVEWQTTANFDTPSGVDANNNGWDDEYDNGNPTPEVISNNDGVGAVDYLSQDSDGDGSPDYVEGFDDGGIEGAATDDLEDRATAFIAAGGDPFFYVNSDDGDSDGIPDWMEDADTDGVPNFLDPQSTFYHDDDNDGLIDLYDDDDAVSGGAPSNLPDFNSDGEPDFRDMDNNVGALPIELISFTAIKVGINVQLDWSTSTEINNDYFTIERSLDGQTFEPILTEKGAGTSSKILHYKRFDNQPMEGYNYYRLRQTDFDGENKEFNIEVVKFETLSITSGGNQYNVYPNPTISGQLFLEINQPPAGEYQVEVLSSVGKLLSQRSLQIESKTLHFEQEILRGLNLAKGVYFLKVQSDDQSETFKFIVQ